MQFSTVAILALAGFAFADRTVTDYTTKVYTITSCAPTVTNCPATVSTVVHMAVTTYPANATAAFAASGTGAGAYAKASLTGYHGPAYTGAAGQIKAAGALAGVGAVAALLL